jgi:hypothetical protein
VFCLHRSKEADQLIEAAHSVCELGAGKEFHEIHPLALRRGRERISVGDGEV